MYTCIHTYMHAHTHILTYTYTYTVINICTYTYTYTYIYACVHMYICAYVHMCMCIIALYVYMLHASMFYTDICTYTPNIHNDSNNDNTMISTNHDNKHHL